MPADVQQLVIAPKPRRPAVVMLAVSLVVVIGAAVTAFFVIGSGSQSTDDAYVEGRVVRISPKASGQLVSLRMDDNDAVSAGDLLLEIDPVDHQAKFDQAVAVVAAAESAVEQAKAAVLRAEANVAEAQAAARAAATEAERRASDYRRYEAMGTDGVSAQQPETAKHASDAANDQKDAAEKKAVAADAELNVAKTNIGSAEAQVAATKAQLRFAQLQLEYTKIYAPEAGNVTKRNVESGDFGSAGQPLLAIVWHERWVVANFKEVQLRHMRVGQRVEVKILFEPDQAGIERLGPGMSVEVTVDTQVSSQRLRIPELILPLDCADYVAVQAVSYAWRRRRRRRSIPALTTATAPHADPGSGTAARNALA